MMAKGPFNSWDRQPFAWDKHTDGTLNLTPSMITIHHNLFFANYGAGQAVDNDDGSSVSLTYVVRCFSFCVLVLLLRSSRIALGFFSHPQYYDIHHNVQYASGGLKSDYAGHDKLYHHNLNVGGGNCGSESLSRLMIAIASSVPQ